MQKKIFLILLCLYCVPVSALDVQNDPIADLISGKPVNTSQVTAQPRDKAAASAASKNTQRPWVIVIDPGHGGKDAGAVGHRGVLEKDVVLQLSRRVAKSISKKIPAHIIFTRHDDRFLSLDQRDQIAVAKQADMFLSIHANAAANKNASGIEIYYLNNTTDEASNRLAERENKGSQKSLSDIQHILSTLIQTDSTEFSIRLARDIKNMIQKKIQPRYKLGRLEIKQALFYVLVGAQTPSILLEAGFVTNPTEAGRLSQRKYQEQLAEAIAEGVATYFNRAKIQKDYRG